MPNPTYFNLNQEKQERIMEAAIDEMGNSTYEHLNLANIIRNSNIPRGSFYQYFKDKDDLYHYFYQYIGQKKYEFYGDLFLPDKDIPFLDRFYQIYVKGFHFAKTYPNLMKAGQKMMSSDYFVKNNMVKIGMDQAIDLYAKFIEIDQQKGLIKKDIDPKFLATFLLEFMSKVTLDEFMKETVDFNEIDKMVKQLVDILKKGIE